MTRFYLILLLLLVNGVIIVILSPSSDQPAFSQAPRISGAATVLDGDTLEIGTERIRLRGIDAPEKDQLCHTASNTSWRCGEVAARALNALIDQQPVTCSYSNRDSYGQVLGTCFQGSTHLNQQMVLRGMALAYRRYSYYYVAQEIEAKQHARGLWQGRFMSPERWRRQQ